MYIFENQHLSMIRPTLIDLNSEELHYYLLMVSLEVTEAIMSLKNLSDRIRAPSKTEYTYLNVFNI